MKMKIKADRFYGKIQKVAWILLSLFALYIFLTIAEIVSNPCENLGEVRRVTEMIEHLLAGCVVLLGGGALFEYMSSD